MQRFTTLKGYPIPGKGIFPKAVVRIFHSCSPAFKPTPKAIRIISATLSGEETGCEYQRQASVFDERRHEALLSSTQLLLAGTTFISSRHENTAHGFGHLMKKTTTRNTPNPFKNEQSKSFLAELR